MVIDRIKAADKRRVKFTSFGLAGMLGLTSLFHAALTTETTGSTKVNLEQNEELQYQQISNGIYIGSTLDNVITGEGTLYYINGDTYEGQLVDELKSGSGTLTLKNGDVYTGSFENDLKSGTGEAQLSNGNSYEGQFREDHLSGTGRYEYADGATYEGEFIEGKRNGQGIFTYVDGSSYEGEWLNDKYNGEFFVFFLFSLSFFHVSYLFGMPANSCIYSEPDVSYVII